mmetsp:Transcript_10528/g.14774  ORF Transcript_10528/g.14774 Transcript_10528/m.14774 type:complete len:811 (-) Transcript_10528:2351-4783(-)
MADDEYYVPGRDENVSYGGESASNVAGTYESQTDYSNIPDILLLNHLCTNATEKKPETWEQVREWLRTHQAEEVRQAAEQRGDSNMTALHFACRNGPPPDVIDVFLSIAVDTVQWPDSFGWLPIHYACACGASIDVIQSLAEAYPESKTTVDRRGRTPLHFALGNASDKPASPAIVALLSSTGAASYADDNGMLPLHYACAYGASEEALYVLTEDYPDGITTKDRRHRTPLHFSLSNAGRKASPSAVRLLLNLSPEVVNNRDGGILPLRVLAEFSQSVTNTPEVHPNVQKCLLHLLNADPDPTADFFTALQSLPEWLEEKAVVMPNVQHLLNDKIACRFPTAVLMGDLYFIIVTIIFYSLAVVKSIEKRNDCLAQADMGVPCTSSDRAVDTELLIALYLGAVYFLMREVIQIISLLSLKSITVWLKDGTNWLNIVFVIVVLFWSLVMHLGKFDDLDSFRTGTAICVIFLWVKLVVFMRFMLIDFSVFVGGLISVLRRLAAFITALIIILLMFAQMFITIYRNTDNCMIWNKRAPQDPTDLVFGDELAFHFCEYTTAFIKVVTMLLGEVSEEDFTDDKFAIVVFCLFMFLVVILLANVLIAIVTDSYKVIQDTRAAIVFWTNRLDFVAEMDAISSGPWKVKVKESLGINVSERNIDHKKKVTFGQEFWIRLMDLFESDVENTGMLSVEFWCYLFLRVVTAIFIFPGWIFLGLISFGWLWPPQIREHLFTSTITKNSDIAEDEEQRKRAVENLRSEVKILKEDLMQELAVDRSQLVQLKSQVTERKTEIANEMKHIKRIMTMLFEQHSAFAE